MIGTRLGGFVGGPPMEIMVILSSMAQFITKLANELIILVKVRATLIYKSSMGDILELRAKLVFAMRKITIIATFETTRDTSEIFKIAIDIHEV